MPIAPESDFLRPVLQNWPAPFRTAKLLDRHQGFSGALVCRISAADQDFAIRGWPCGSLPPARLTGLHHFLRYLQQQGVPQVSVPIATVSGTTVAKAGNRWWQLEPWMPGQASFCEAPNQNKLTALMQLLARLHQVAEHYEPASDSAAWFSVQASAPSPGVIERVQLIERWKDTNPQTVRRLMGRSSLPASILEHLEEILSRFRRHAIVVQTEMQSLLGVSFRLQPCPRDLWHDHVLFTGEDITGLIDFGACRSENPMIDLSRLLGSFFPDDRAQWTTAVSIYESSRALIPEEQRLLSAFDRSQRLLSGMTWIQRLILDVDIPTETDRIENRLNAILKGMRPLDSFIA